MVYFLVEDTSIWLVFSSIPKMDSNLLWWFIHFRCLFRLNIMADVKSDTSWTSQGNVWTVYKLARPPPITLRFWICWPGGVCLHPLFSGFLDLDTVARLGIGLGFNRILHISTVLCICWGCGICVLLLFCLWLFFLFPSSDWL